MTDEPPKNVQHTMRQSAEGEFSPFDSEARGMSANQFAAAHSSDCLDWGHAPDGSRPYVAVNVDGTDYLWRKSDGCYDGWDRHL